LHRTKIGISAALQKLLRNRNLNINRSLLEAKKQFHGDKKIYLPFICKHADARILIYQIATNKRKIILFS